jgi:hypothetical protein
MTMKERKLRVCFALASTVLHTPAVVNAVRADCPLTHPALRRQNNVEDLHNNLLIRGLL